MPVAFLHDFNIDGFEQLLASLRFLIAAFIDSLDFFHVKLRVEIDRGLARGVRVRRFD